MKRGANNYLFSLKNLLVKQPKALLKCPAQCMYSALIAQIYYLQFSKYIHMDDPILPLQLLCKIVLVDIQLVSVRDNLTRCIWHLSDRPTARPHWLSDILFYFFNKFIYLFIGCVGSSLLRVGFL